MQCFVLWLFNLEGQVFFFFSFVLFVFLILITIMFSSLLVLLPRSLFDNSDMVL